MSASFKDSEGLVWSPRITVNTLRLFEEESGINLLDVVAEKLQPFISGNESDETVRVPLSRFTGLLKDVMGGKLGNLLLLAYLSVYTQAKERRIQRDAFYERISGKELAEASKAVGAAYSDFFRSVIPAVGEVEGVVDGDRKRPDKPGK